MIAGIEGRLKHKGDREVVVGVKGIDFRLIVPSSTVERLGEVGEEVRLHTHLVAREDNIILYGFASEEELKLFQALISVSGTGPKVALSVLSTFTPAEAMSAIAAGDTGLLSRAPGVGKKMASRLVLELRGKMEKLATPFPTAYGEVMDALIALGYSPSEAMKACSSLPEEGSVEEKLKLALRRLAP